MSENKNGQQNKETFEERFHRMSQERASAREARRLEKAKSNPSAKLTVDASGDHVAVYKSRAAAAKAKTYKPRPIGVYRRTVKLVKGLKLANAAADAIPYCTAEKRRELCMEVVNDAYAPLCTGVENMSDTLWSFLCALGWDFLEILVFLINLVIKVSYYAGSVMLFLWDRIWDLRIWFDTHKKSVFQVFAGVLTTVALGMILISSMSGYEYSYYGRTLGVTRTKQAVYDVIELLGDKLSESSGANISFDVERDIKFDRVWGFGLEVDSSDDILNTITYMKDIRVEAFAIVIDGRQTAILENEEAARNLINNVKAHFVPEKEGYTYNSVSIAETVNIEQVNVVLADIWNPDSAARYIETGFAGTVPEGLEASPLVTVYATATVTKDVETKYGITYRRDANMYMDEVSVVTAGKPGITRTTSVVQMVNGIEVSNVEQSKVVVSNPVNAVYKQGTKALPDRTGTGTWIFPLKTGYKISSRFGYRNTGIAGASTNHKGVDLSCAMGTKIYAADGGVVTFSGLRGNLGYLVIINHGGFYETYYAHCSKLLVSTGQKVYQGQNIALVGRSGVASGPHLHFEVHYKGVPFNPMTLY